MSGLDMHAADLDSQSTTHLRPFKSSKIPAKGVNEKVFDIPSALASGSAARSQHGSGTCGSGQIKTPLCEECFFFRSAKETVYFHAQEVFNPKQAELVEFISTLAPARQRQTQT